MKIDNAYKPNLAPVANRSAPAANASAPRLFQSA